MTWIVYALSALLVSAFLALIFAALFGRDDEEDTYSGDWWRDQ